MFDWVDFIKVSKTFVKYAPINSTVSEGFYRSSVSRAYYATYHAALNYAQSKGYNFNTYQRFLRSKAGYAGGFGSHAVLAQFLLDYSDTKVNSLGASLKRCHRRRIAADYTPNLSIDEIYTNITIAQTDSIHQLIPTLP